ncbi:hypothetical protein [Streptomyces sp. DH7]|uniref:hypothetical protein n=1 Tax=Streptomyces sp. DH7 TaxID=2857006 RepID=UPI001E4A8FDA|nr:hypothetical protein [Streptomyces sp. DH7]
MTLPRWTKGPQNSDGQDTHDEDWFNRKAAEQDGYLLFDKDTVRTVKFRGGEAWKSATSWGRTTS